MMVISHSITVNREMRGASIPRHHREVVERLERRARDVQSRFELAESTAFLLEEMLNEQSGLAAAIENTYEGNAFVKLRFQLFRMLIVDLCAAVLDDSGKAASIRKLVQTLRRKNSAAVSSLKEYLADPQCLHVSVNAPELGSEAIDRMKQQLIEESIAESRRAVESEWRSIVDAEDLLLNSVAGKRIKWARDKAVAHYEHTEAGSLVALHDDPPHGEGKLMWAEPIEFLKYVKPFVYEVVGLITATSSVGEPDKFYARAFWDRFKNGRSDLTP